VKTLLDFTAKVGRENILKPTIGNESSQEISRTNGFRVATFPTTRIVIVKIKCSNIPCR
jgi:hypothetical protein